MPKKIVFANLPCEYRFFTTFFCCALLPWSPKKQNYGLTIKSKWQNINVMKVGRGKCEQFLNTFLSTRNNSNCLSFLSPVSRYISAPKKCLKPTLFSLPCFTYHKYPPKFFIFIPPPPPPVSQYISIPKKYLKLLSFYPKFHNTFLSPSWILSGLLHCALPICLMLCLSGSRSYSKSIEDIYFEDQIIYNCWI